MRQSGLRKTFQPDEDAADSTPDGEDDGPVVVRPKAASKMKKKVPKTKLSFGGDAMEGEDEDPASFATSKASNLGRAAVGLRGLPMRSVQDDDDRPKYSKSYLEELQSSTPTTPRDTPPQQSTDDDAMILDASELEGAMIVDSPAPAPAVSKTEILSDAQIQERKQRRARLAQEQGFLSVESDDDADAPKEKGDSRLKADDENVGEGFDEYVEDGGLSLGKRAEKERKKRDRQKMADMISAAEGHSSDDSSDEDAERRIAYESAQTRAGMDGLKRKTQSAEDELLKVPQKITPLPDLSECVAKLQQTLQSMKAEIEAKKAEVALVEAEKEAVIKREAEVQALLDETGKKYQEAMKTTDVVPPSAGVAALQMADGRGLESLGTTPSRAMDEDA